MGLGVHLGFGLGRQLCFCGQCSSPGSLPFFGEFTPLLKCQYSLPPVAMLRYCVSCPSCLGCVGGWNLVLRSYGVVTNQQPNLLALQGNDRNAALGL